MVTSPLLWTAIRSASETRFSGAEAYRPGCASRGEDQILRLNRSPLMINVVRGGDVGIVCRVGRNGICPIAAVDPLPRAILKRPILKVELVQRDVVPIPDISATAAR